MGTLHTLTAEQAEERFDWLADGVASRELEDAENEASTIYDPPGTIYPMVDIKVIEKLEEIARVAREVAKHYRDKQEAK